MAPCSLPLLTPLLPPQVFPTAVRAKAMALATFANRAVAALVASRFLTLADAMGYGGASLLLAAFCLLVAAFVYVAVPETKARSRLSPHSHPHSRTAHASPASPSRVSGTDARGDDGPLL